MPLGDRAVVVRFANTLDLDANGLAIAFARAVQKAGIDGVGEVAANLVSVCVHYDPRRIGFRSLSGEIGLLLSGLEPEPEGQAVTVKIEYGGAAGPDFDDVVRQLDLTAAGFIAAHGASPLRVLAVGFAPGFIYCGMHEEALVVPRRSAIHPSVPPGSVLFAAGQTAIAATPMPTGWPVIGRADLVNFDPDREPPVKLVAGDKVRFEGVR